MQLNQNDLINDLEYEQSNQSNQISEIQNNIDSIESKNLKDINNIQSSITQINCKFKQFHKKYIDDVKFKYQSKDDFEYNGYNKFNGIIKHLSRKNKNQNVHLMGIVNVTASSVWKDYKPQYIVDLDNKTNYFHSRDQPNSWIQYDFIKYKVRPTAYSIRTRHDWGSGNNHPKNWCIEGSNDPNKMDST